MNSSKTSTSSMCSGIIGVGEDVTKLFVSSTPICAKWGGEVGKTLSIKTSSYSCTLAEEMDSTDPNTLCTIAGSRERIEEKFTRGIE